MLQHASMLCTMPHHVRFFIHSLEPPLHRRTSRRPDPPLNLLTGCAPRLWACVPLWASSRCHMEAAGDFGAAWAPPRPGLESGLASRLSFLRWAKFDPAKVCARKTQAECTVERFFPPPATLCAC